MPEIIPTNPNPTPNNQPALDPQAVNLAKAIRQTESGGNFTAKGKSGEFGAYQYTPDTWKLDSTKYLGADVPLEQATPQQQNEVAYKKIKELKDAGHNVGQIASIWNSGQPEWEGKVGVNKFGVPYDVPKYVNSVASAYQKIKGGQDVGADPNNPSSTANTSQPEKKDETYGAILPASADDNPLEAGGKALVNLPSSFLHLLGGVGHAVMHPIDTVKGVAKAGLGGLEKLGGHEADDNTATFDALVGSLKDRYGSLENLQKTATNDPFGFGTDVISLLTGGGAALDAAKGLGMASKVAEGAELTQKAGTVSEAIDNGISKVGQAAIKPVKKVAGMAGNVASEAVAAPLGVGGGVVKEAVGSAMAGGDRYKAFVEGLKGSASPEELVNQAKDALGEVVQTRGNTYQDMLKALENDKTTYDISPIYKEVDNQLGKFGIKVGEDGLDFSRSKFALDGTAQKDISTLYDYVKSYGTQAGDRTAIGIDNLKKVLGGYFSPNSDYRAFVQGIKGTTRDVLEKVPGYSEEMKKYADMSDQIEDIQKGLSLNDKAMVETTFKKLTSAFKQNNEFRKQLIDELDQATGGTLSAKIAGQQMSSFLPRGLAGSLEKVGGVAGVLSGHFLPVLAGAMVTSPRVVGTFIRGLGLGAQATEKVLTLLDKMGPTGSLIEGGNAVNRLTPPTSAFSASPQE